MSEDLQDGKVNKHILLNRLINLYGKDVLKIANIYMKSQDAAEDVFQEVFFRIYKKLDAYDDIREVKRWIIKITLNVCKDLRKCPWNNKCYLLKEDDESLDNIVDFNFNNEVNMMETNEIVWKILMELPDKYKDILILYCINEFSYREISDILNISEGAVKTRLRRARLAFRRRYEKLNGN